MEARGWWKVCWAYCSTINPRNQARKAISVRSYPGIGCRRTARRGLASVARATAGECPSCARVASGPQRRPAGAHKEGAVRIDARYNAVLQAFDFQTLKMSDGQSLAHLPRF